MAFGESGFFGNLLFSQHYLPDAGMSEKQHKHDNDHVSFIVQGSVYVTIGSSEPKLFKAPTFVAVRAGYEHQFTAAEDNTVWYCIFAMRDSDGDVIPHFHEDNAPSFDVVSNTTFGDWQWYKAYQALSHEFEQLRRENEALRHKVRITEAHHSAIWDYFRAGDSIPTPPSPPSISG